MWEGSLEIVMGGGGRRIDCVGNRVGDREQVFLASLSEWGVAG